MVHGYYSPPIVFRIDSTFMRADSSDIQHTARATEDDFPGEYWTGNTTTYENSELFVFDPNLATVADWLRLGLSEKTAATIDRYRKKGGRFYKKEDLQRIWGLPKGFYDRVKDFIDIPPREEKKYPVYEKTEYVRSERSPKIIQVNNADSVAFEALPGIGPKLSARIVGFREKLGGFYTVDQIGETYGLPDSTFQEIRPFLTIDASAIRTININTATKDELRSHPYIKWNLANAIVAYRTQHGNFQSVEDLKKIAVIDEKTYEKVTRYLRID